MSVAEELYDLWLGTPSRSLIVVGTAKNVGKTTTVNALLRVASARGTTVGLTSLGRDGEAFDAVDGAPKPRIFIEPGTVVAAGRALVPHPRGIEVLDERETSALGPIVFYRSKIAQHVEISGAPTARSMRAIIERLIRFGPERVIVDGAIDRVAITSSGHDAIVVATGAALAATLEETVSQTAAFVARLGSRVVACTSCPVGEGRQLDPGELVRALGERLAIPVFDIASELRS